VTTKTRLVGFWTDGARHYRGLLVAIVVCVAASAGLAVPVLRCARASRAASDAV
jgi:hypothetical protein